MHGFEEQVIGELEPASQFPGDIQEEQGEQLAVFVVQPVEQFLGKHDDVAVHHRHCREVVLVHADEGHVSKAFSFAQPFLFDLHLPVRDEQGNETTLDDVDMCRVVACLENGFSSLASAHLHAADDFILLCLGDAAEHGNVGEQGGERVEVFEGFECVHGRGKTTDR